MEDTLDEAFSRPSVRHIRKWSTDTLHAKLHSNELWPAERSMAESELRRREAWNTPAKWALIVSALALVLSIASLVISLTADPILAQ